MYILIFEDGATYSAEEVGDDDLAMADEGYIDIIDVRKPSNPYRYASGEWEELTSIDDN